MRLAGFSIIRNALRYDYPFEESLRSLLPLVDELHLAVGKSEDATLQRAKALAKREPKLKVFETTWDSSQRQGGFELSRQTNLALARCKGDWGVYLQADEVLHEDDLDLIRQSARRQLKTKAEGLSFDYLHFYGSYQTLQDQPRKWYRRAVRCVRLNRGVQSAGDAYGFRVARGNSSRRLRVAPSGARVFHYGWTRPPETMLAKQMNLDRMYHDEAWVRERHAKTLENARRFYQDRGHLKFFLGSHPQSMAQRVASQDWAFDHQIGRQWPAWLRRIYIALIYPFTRNLRRS